MTDFFDRLESELTQAAARHPAADVMPSPGRRRSWWRSRPVLFAALGLVTAGTGTAAIAALDRGEPSRPLQGRVDNARQCREIPDSCLPGQPTTSRYRFLVLPFGAVPLEPPELGEAYAGAGRAGWCGATEADQGRGSSCGPAWAPEISARIAGTGFGTGDDTVSFIVVDDRVATIRLRDGRRIRTARDPSLPDDWRAASWSGGHDSPVTVSLLDERGRRLPNPGGTKHGLTAVQPAGPVGTRRDRPCTITSSRMDVVDARTILEAPKASPRLRDGTFLICGTAQIGPAADMTRALVLLDARSPGSRPADLPGAAPASDAPDVVDVGADVSARRVGDAWLVVARNGAVRPRGRAAVARRHELLRALDVRR